MQTTGNTVLITGGGSGIGLGLAKAFHERGNQVVLAGRDLGKLENAIAAHPGMAAVAVDVTDPSDIRRFAGEVVSLFPDLNVLINNAGIMRVENVFKQNWADVEQTIATNLVGPIQLTSALLPHLQAKPQASVLNVTSGLAYVPFHATPTYSATKSGLHAYTQCLRAQLAGTSVSVIEIIPPYVQTELVHAGQATDPAAMPLDAYIHDTMAQIDNEPGVQEVVIERVAPLRWAVQKGTFAEAFAHLTEMGEHLLAATPGRGG